MSTLNTVASLRSLVILHSDMLLEYANTDMQELSCYKQSFVRYEGVFVEVVVHLT